MLLREHGVRTMLDAACGDLNWIRHVELDLDRYVGVDVVPELIDANEHRFQGAGREFLRRDITRDDLPRVDLILCRDALIHLSFKDAIATLRNFRRSRSRLLLTTTYPATRRNRDAVTGMWHPLNLEREPFLFPRPLAIVSESRARADGTMTGKCLGLWRFEDLPTLGAGIG